MEKCHLLALIFVVSPCARTAQDVTGGPGGMGDAMPPMDLVAKVKALLYRESASYDFPNPFDENRHPLYDHFDSHGI